MQVDFKDYREPYECTPSEMWLDRADRFRCLVEPFEIANYYKAGVDRSSGQPYANTKGRSTIYSHLQALVVKAALGRYTLQQKQYLVASTAHDFSQECRAQQPPPPPPSQLRSDSAHGLHELHIPLLGDIMPSLSWQVESPTGISGIP